MLNGRWPHGLSTWNWVRDAIIIRDRLLQDTILTKPPVPSDNCPSWGLLRDYEPSDGTFWSTIDYTHNRPDTLSPAASQPETESFPRITVHYLEYWHRRIYSGKIKVHVKGAFRRQKRQWDSRNSSCVAHEASICWANWWYYHPISDHDDGSSSLNNRAVNETSQRFA